MPSPLPQHLFDDFTTLAGITLFILSAPSLIPALIQHRHRLARRLPRPTFTAVVGLGSILVKLVT